MCTFILCEIKRSIIFIKYNTYYLYPTGITTIIIIRKNIYNLVSRYLLSFQLNILYMYKTCTCKMHNYMCLYYFCEILVLISNRVIMLRIMNTTLFLKMKTYCRLFIFFISNVLNNIITINFINKIPTCFPVSHILRYLYKRSKTLYIYI